MEQRVEMENKMESGNAVLKMQHERMDRETEDRETEDRETEASAEAVAKPDPSSKDRAMTAQTEHALRVKRHERLKRWRE